MYKNSKQKRKYGIDKSRVEIFFTDSFFHGFSLRLGFTGTALLLPSQPF